MLIFSSKMLLSKVGQVSKVNFYVLLFFMQQFATNVDFVNFFSSKIKFAFSKTIKLPSNFMHTGLSSACSMLIVIFNYFIK